MAYEVPEEVEENLDEETEGEDNQDLESEESDDSSEEETVKKVSPMKKLREELKRAKQALAKKETSDKISLAPDVELESKFFFIENPEAKELKEQIKGAVAKFPNMSFEEAFAYVKATKPKESVSKTDFSFKSKSKPADIMNMSDDEASEKLSPSEYLKYTRSSGSSFVKSARK